MSGVPRLAEDGPEIGPFGFFSGERWESHAWSECDGWIVDITADQFDAAPVIVVPITDVRYRSGSADTALPEFAAARRAAVNAIQPAWAEFRACGFAP